MTLLSDPGLSVIAQGPGPPVAPPAVDLAPEAPAGRTALAASGSACKWPRGAQATFKLSLQHRRIGTTTWLLVNLDPKNAVWLSAVACVLNERQRVHLRGGDIDIIATVAQCGARE